MKYNILFVILFASTNVFSQTQPNIILIEFDDLNDWIQGFAGHPQTVTPKWKWVENRGTTFTNAYTNAPQCGPSRVSMLTGKDPDYTKIYTNQDLICDDFRANFSLATGNETVYTLPEILKDNGGYYTYSIGKIFHCHENEPDYDSVTILDCEKLLSWNKVTQFADGGGDEDVIIDYGDANDLGVAGYAYAAIPDSLEVETVDYKSADAAIDFIDDYAINPGNYCNKPFFLGVGFRRPHGPEYVPEKYFSTYYDEGYYADPYDLPYDDPIGAPYNGIAMPPQPATMWNDYYNLPVGGVARALVDENPVHTKVMQWAYGEIVENGYPPIADGLTDLQRKFALEESKRANMVMAYLAAIKFADAQLGRIITALQENPEVMNNTIIVLISDHGYSLGEKQHWKKATLWETDIRIPMVIADLRAPAKKSCKKFVSLIDLFPTICEYGDAALPAFPDGSTYLDGYSFKALVTNPTTPWNKPILSTYKNGKNLEDQGSCFPHYSVRDNEYHYIQYHTNGAAYPTGCDFATSVVQEELYHIGKKREIDPNEWTNLASDPAYAATKDYLMTFLPGGVNYLQFEKDAIDDEFPTGTPMAQVYPNPAETAATLFLDMEGFGEATITIVNAQGQVVQQLAASIANQATTVTLDIANLPTGLYVITTEYGSIKTYNTLIVAR